MVSELSVEVEEKLAGYGLHDFSETALRQQLELKVNTYTLIKLADWPARRWKCRYRLMMGEGMYDAQSVSGAYALGLLAVLQKPAKEQSSEEEREED